MDKLDIEEIPQLDVDINFDTQEANSQNVVHPAFVPILVLTVMIA